MNESTAHVLVGFLLTIIGGVMLAALAETGALGIAIAGAILAGGWLMLTIGTIAKGVRLGQAERDDERDLERGA